jgi:hypothetical protein
MAKTAQAVYVPQWYEDASILNRVIAYTVGRRKLTEFAQLNDLVEHPEKYSYLYTDYQESLLNQINPNNPVTVEFFDSRFYRIGSRWLESNTTVLWAYPAPGLVQFIGNVGGEQAELRKIIAGDRGTKVHDALQRNRPVNRSDFADDEWLLLMNAQAFFDEERPEMILNEEAVWDIERGYAGRIDRLVSMRGGKVTLIDFKTGHVGREAWLQTAANKNSVQKTKGIHVDSWGILSLNAKTKAGWKYYCIEERSDVKDEGLSNEQAFERDMVVFDAVHTVWRDAFKSLKPKHFPYAPPETLKLMIPVKLMVGQLQDESESFPVIGENAEEAIQLPADQTQSTDESDDFGPVAPLEEIAAPAKNSEDTPPAKPKRSRNVARKEETTK